MFHRCHPMIRIWERNIAELSLCFQGRERKGEGGREGGRERGEERELFELRVNAVKMAKQAYLHLGSVHGDSGAVFWCHLLDSIISRTCV